MLIRVTLGIADEFMERFADRINGKDEGESDCPQCMRERLNEVVG